MAGVEVVVAKTRLVHWWRGRAGSQTCLGVEAFSEGLNVGAENRAESGMSLSVWLEHLGGWKCRSWMWGRSFGEKIELVGLDHISLEMPTDFQVDILVGNQEEKVSAVQRRSPSWR